MIRSPRGTRVVPRGLPFPAGHSYCVIEEPGRRILGVEHYTGVVTDIQISLTRKLT